MPPGAHRGSGRKSSRLSGVRACTCSWFFPTADALQSPCSTADSEATLLSSAHGEPAGLLDGQNHLCRHAIDLRVCLSHQLLSF